MRTVTSLLLVPLVAACAGPTAERAPESPAAFAVPEADTADRGTPRVAGVLPIEQVAVRVERSQEGRLVILEFLNPGLTPQDRTALLLAFGEGRVWVATEGGPGVRSWTTTLVPATGAVKPAPSP